MFQCQPSIFVRYTRLDDVRGQPGQLRDPAGLPSVDALKGGDLSDRLVFAFVDEPLPVMRQPERPDQRRVPRGVPLG